MADHDNDDNVAVPVHAVLEESNDFKTVYRLMAAPPSSGSESESDSNSDVATHAGGGDGPSPRPQSDSGDDRADLDDSSPSPTDAKKILRLLKQCSMSNSPDGDKLMRIIRVNDRLATPKTVTNKFTDVNMDLAATKAALRDGPKQLLTAIAAGTKVDMNSALLKLQAPRLYEFIVTELERNNADSVIIDDVNVRPAALKKVYHFLFLANIEFENVLEAVEVLYIAVKFDIPALVGFAQQYLKACTAPKNAILILRLAHTRELREMENFVLKFINLHKSAIMSSDVMRELHKKSASAAMKLSQFLLRNRT